MRNAQAILNIHQKRGSNGLPLERVYRHLFVPELFLRAYGKIYRNAGAMTQGTTAETVDGMDLQRIHDVIGLLREERYVWTPVRRTEIPKANGKTRPLGIPTWSDKLLQEVLRMLLEPYYEQRFSGHSQGFRPGRSCHSALREVRRVWRGTVWFIEGDIKGCFDNIDHAILLDIIRRDIHDERLVTLIANLLNAGYMENWKYYDSFSGTPQGGIISPLLANIYLSELDKFVEDTLIPAYTRGERRRPNPNYLAISTAITAAIKREDFDEVQRLKQSRRRLMSVNPLDADYRRLRYVRYADDFLLGFTGPKDEANDIRLRLGEFLRSRLNLTLSLEKTFVTHATDDKAKFLGYEIKTTRCMTLLAANGKRAANGCIALLMPAKVVHRYRGRYSVRGKIASERHLVVESEYTILQRYQSVLRGIYNYYCMAVNVSRRMGCIKRILELSMVRTLARKQRGQGSVIRRKFRTRVLGRTIYRVVVPRPPKEPLVAVFGGIPFERVPDGKNAVDFQHSQAWNSPANPHAEVVHRLLADECELCGAQGVALQAHHIRKLADIDRPGRRPRTVWEKIMSAKKRKTLMVCQQCHNDIHAGRYDRPKS
jgi:group II intron reverse transcriptase/maturase